MDREDQRQSSPPVTVGGTPVRRSDIEPYTALRWVGSLFKGAAVFLAVAVVAEFIAGIRVEGTQALSVLLGELARTAVLAVVLWGAGDLVRLMVHLGHDVRAQRIMLSRVAYRLRPGAVDASGDPEGMEELEDPQIGEEMEAAD